MSGATAVQADLLGPRGTGDLMHEIPRARSQRDLDYRSLEILQLYGFDFLGIARKSRAEQKLSDHFTVVGRRRNLTTDFDSTRLDAVLARVFRHVSKEVGCLHLKLYQTDGFDETVTDGNHLRDFDSGTTSAYFFPTHSPKGGDGAVGFFGTQKWLETAELAELNYLATMVFDRTCRLAHSPRRTNKLTKREQECLFWTAAGKTSAEIGTILSLSEHTINNYLVAVCHKLDSVNRAHAVAKAIRQGIIS